MIVNLLKLITHSFYKQKEMKCGEVKWGYVYVYLSSYFFSFICLFVCLLKLQLARVAKLKCCNLSGILVTARERAFISLKFQFIYFVLGALENLKGVFIVNFRVSFSEIVE